MSAVRSPVRVTASFRQSAEVVVSEEGEWASTHSGSEAPAALRPVNANLVAAVDAVSGIGRRTSAAGCWISAAETGAGWQHDGLGTGWRTFGIDPALKTAFARHTELNAPPSTPEFDFVSLSHVLEP